MALHIWHSPPPLRVGNLGRELGVGKNSRTTLCYEIPEPFFPTPDSRPKFPGWGMSDVQSHCGKTQASFFAAKTQTWVITETCCSNWSFFVCLQSQGLLSGAAWPPRWRRRCVVASAAGSRRLPWPTPSRDRPPSAPSSGLQSSRHRRRPTRIWWKSLYRVGHRLSQKDWLQGTTTLYEVR